METIKIEDVILLNINTVSKKDDSIRGIKTISINELKRGDLIVISNHFVKVV